MTVHVLYRFFNSADELLYVGITNNPPLRFGCHQIQKSWWSDVATIKMQHYGDRGELIAAECQAIRNERPRYNIIQADRRAAAVAKKLVEEKQRGATYSLSEVAEQVLPAEWTDAERWLARRLNRGQIRGYRVGRIWRMTEDHVEDLIERFTNDADRPAITPPAPSSAPITVADGLSRRARRRLRSA